MSSDARPAPESSLSCGEAQREIDLLIEDGDLKETERSLLFAHLRTCEDCKAKLEARRRLDVRLRQGFLSIDTSPGFARRVLENLPATQPEIPAEAGASAWLAAAQASRGRRDEAPVGGLAWLTRGYRLPLALAALISIGLCGMLYRYYSMQGQPEEVAQILKIEGEGAGERIRAGRNLALKEGQFLLRGDEISADTEGGKPLVLSLAFRGQPVATVHLKPGAVLRAVSRHQFALNKGEAYFQVRKDRPKEASNERFKVETPLGSVQVTGTEFGVIVPAEIPQYVTVLVSEGAVEVLPNAGAGSTLGFGEEADLLNSGGVSALRPAVSSRLAWVRGAVQLAALPSTSVRPTPAQPDTLTPQPHDTPPAVLIDWQAPAPPIDFTGHRLPQALTVLAQRLGGSAVLLDLAKKSEGMGASTPSTLHLRHSMPLGAVVRWLARENRLRFETSGKLRAAEPGEAIGPVDDGAAPVRIAQALDGKLAKPIEARKEDLAAHLSEIAARAGVNLYFHPADLPPLLAAPPEFNPWRGTLRGELEDAVRCSELDWAFYDGLIYVAAAARIEALTLSARSVEAGEAGDWIGRPQVPEWSLALKQLVDELRAFPSGPLTPRLEAPKVFQNVGLHPDRLELTFRSGVAGQRRMEELLDRLTQSSPEVMPPTGVLNEIRVPGPVRDLVQLAQQAEAKNFRVIAKNNTDMPSQAFVNRALPLGVELEWAARLCGQGVRADAGVLVVDAVPLCYGSPVLQSVNLHDLSRIDPDRARELPQAVAAHVKEWFPELFRDTTLYPLNNRLTFFGDRRQVWAAQRVCRELEADLRKAVENRQPFDFKAWKPAWRIELDKNLAEPFRGDGSGHVPAGAFAGVLRQSGQFIQLRSTLFVDPNAMRRLAQKQIPRLDVTGKTLGEALNLLAEAAGLRVVIEDEVVWLRPTLNR